MTSLVRSLLGRSEARDISTIDDYAAAVSGLQFGWGGTDVSMSALTGTYGKQVVERISNDLVGFASAAYAANGVVFATMAVRMAVFSTIRFQWQRMREGKPSELFGTAALSPLESPWPGGTTQDLLVRMIQDADLAGNAYITRVGTDRIRLRPDRMQIVCEPRIVHGGQLGWRRIGYVHWQDGIGNGDPVFLLLDEVAHFAPTPDPLADFRGMSWLTPVLREIEGDKAMGQHKAAFYEHAATPNLSVSLDKDIRYEAFKRFKDSMTVEHTGVRNAYKTLFLGGGADVKVIGADFAQMDFSKIQGHGETRVAAAGGVPPVIAGFSEGLAAATYSNYAQARRRFGDGTMHPLWQNASGSLATVVDKPQGGDHRLWYDTSDVPFLREDRKDAVDIAQTQAITIRQLIETGYDPDSAVRAVISGDYGLLLGKHSGLTSVQLQSPGADDTSGGDGSAPAADDTDPDAVGAGEGGEGDA